MNATTYEELAKRKTHAPNSRLIEVQNFKLSGISVYRMLLLRGTHFGGKPITMHHLIVCETLSMMTYETPR